MVTQVFPNDNLINSIKRETIAFDGFIDRSSEIVKFRNITENTGSELITETMSTTRRVTFLKKCDYEAVSSAQLSVGNNLIIEHYDVSNTLISIWKAEAHDAFANAKALKTAEIGDYLHVLASVDMVDYIGSNFAVRATEITTKLLGEIV